MEHVELVNEVARLSVLLNRQQAITDVLTVVIGNLLPAFALDTATRARVEAALEVFGEDACAQTNPVYLGAARQCTRQLLRALQSAPVLPPERSD